MSAGAMPDRAGPYRLERELGRGGMGVVYLGSRDDQEFDKLVAVKLLSAAVGTQDLLRRFRRERQILADLEHPNIARLLDGGQTEDGKPFLIMEYVSGQPLLRYCVGNKLPVARRLELFRAVCRAVSHAHARLVVHRDIKPSNILVGEDGVPKLLDFGIAKVLDRPPESDEDTNPSAVIYTPAYASPEQIRGERVGTSSDIYALGVVLFELLSEQHPFGEAEWSALSYRILHEEPGRPSVIARQHGRDVPAELDHVVLKAMAKEPEARYASAGQLAEDVDRFLGGFPVQAYAASAWYRAAKFVRRYPVSVSLAALSITSILALAAGLALQSRRLAEQRDTAVRERGRAEQVSDFLVDMFNYATPQTNGGKPVTAREMLDFGARRLADRRIADHEARAEVLSSVAEAYSRIGAFPEARKLGEESVRVLEAAPSDPRLLARVYLTYVNALDSNGDLKKAESAAERLVELSTEAYGPRHIRVAYALGTLGTIRSKQFRYREGVAAQRESLALAESLRDADSAMIERFNLSLGLARLGKVDESAALLRANLAYIEEDRGPDHFYAAIVHANRGNLETVRGRHRAALAEFDRALPILRKAGNEPFPPVGTLFCDRALTLLDMGDHAAAEAPLAECESIRARTVKPGSADAIATVHLRALSDLAKGNLAKAERGFASALASYRQSFGPDHIGAARELRWLGRTRLAAGDADGARKHLTEAATLWTRLGGPESPEYAALLLDRGASLLLSKLPAEAEALFRQAGSLRRQFHLAAWLAAEADVRLGAALAAQGKGEEAGRLVKAAIETLEADPPPSPALLAEARAVVAPPQRSQNRVY